MSICDELLSRKKYLLMIVVLILAIEFLIRLRSLLRLLNQQFDINSFMIHSKLIALNLSRILSFNVTSRMHNSAREGAVGLSMQIDLGLVFLMFCKA